jgi:predicted membrane-bound dolichyl-phosphate-mannose-protein mannosyltransferase
MSHLLESFKSDFNPRKNFFDRIFIYLLLASLLLGFIWLDKPDGSLIFDEKYYVNVARNLLNIPHDPDVYSDATPGTDPNREHPFLAKGIIAFSMMIFGDNAWGWRIPSIIFGAIALFAFYLLVKRLSKKSELALFASMLFVFSNLIFIHSRIATLDIFMLAFMLLGFYLYLIEKTYLSAFSMALATLSKLGGLYGFLVIIIFHFVNSFLKSRSTYENLDWRKLVRWFGKYAITYVIVGIILLTIFDRVWVGYNNPLDHISYMYDYYKSLTSVAPEGIASYPWQWLINEVKIPYLTVNVDVRANGKLIGSHPSIAFQGAINPLIIYLAIPTIVYCIYAVYKKRDETALFTTIWFIMTYLPFYPMSIITHRIMYLFYFLPTLPSVCIAISYLFYDRKTDRIVILSYLFAVLIGFVLLFPFKLIP